MCCMHYVLLVNIAASQDDATVIGIAMLVLVALLIIGFIATLLSAKHRHENQQQYFQGIASENQQEIHPVMALPMPTAARTHQKEQETEPLHRLPMRQTQQKHTQEEQEEEEEEREQQEPKRVGLAEVLARWLVWIAIERRKHPQQQQAMQRTRHFAPLFRTMISEEDEGDEKDTEEEEHVKQIPAPVPAAYVNPLSGKSYNLPGLLAQGERVFLIALKGFIWNIHELYVLNGRKVTRDGFVIDPRRDPPTLQTLKLSKVEWDYLIGPSKATPEGKEPGLLRQSGTITIDENNGVTIWPFESAEAAFLHCKEWLAAYIEDEREQEQEGKEKEEGNYRL